ncbi:uncharacterized protein LOC144617473 isoform X2 [Crassostrea virginica]
MNSRILVLLTAVDALRLNMPKRKVLQEEASKKRLNKGVDQPHFILDNIPPKEEHGLVKQFRKGILYKQISQDEGKEREVKESSGFRYFFRHGCKKLCVDATDESRYPFLG